MPRQASQAAPASSSTPSAPKRRASTRLSSTSKRPKYVSSSPESQSGKTTSKQSKYFEPEAEMGTSSHSDADEYAARPAGKKNELWREGVKTGLGPGKEIFIQKPKMRDDGGVPYRDESLHPNTKLFLLDLKENNERQWLKAHDAEFRAAKKDWETFVESLTEKITEQDGTIPELPAKDVIFRIHRDVRFSKNPTPYKAHFSAAWSRTGKKGNYAAYYVHFEPGSCFVGSGLWMPEADKLALLREEIDQHSDRLKTVLRRADMRREIFDGIPDKDEAAVEAFGESNKESALKVRPKGYEVDNKNIQLLRLRSFTIGKRISDAEIMASDVQDRIAALIGVMEPFVTYLNSVVMPDPADQDPGFESDASEEDGAAA